MDIKIGDILRCKKEFYYSNRCYTMKSESYVITRIYDTEISLTPCLDNFDRTNISFVVDKNHSNHIQSYIWDHFETKLDKAKRIISGYKNR